MKQVRLATKNSDSISHDDYTNLVRPSKLTMPLSKQESIGSKQASQRDGRGGRAATVDLKQTP